MDNTQNPSTYYENMGEMSDAILRCADCKRLVTHADIAKRGSCACGNRRLSEVRSLSAWEWIRIYVGLTRFPHRLAFLKEFRR